MGIYRGRYIGEYNKTMDSTVEIKDIWKNIWNIEWNITNNEDFMGVSITGGTHKWIVSKNPIKLDDLGVPRFQETSVSFCLVLIINHL